MIPKFKTIVDAQIQIELWCQERGYRQDIQRGSFENEDTYRMQLPFVAVEITHPLRMLDLPKHITTKVLEDYYHDYLLNESKQPGEEYTYGSRASYQIPMILEMLRNTPNTNQAAICISSPEDVRIKYPACLREITFKTVNGKLNLSSYWRSNDIGSAFIINQGGLAFLLRDVADYCGLEVGSMFYASDGAHVYTYGSSKE